MPAGSGVVFPAHGGTGLGTGTNAGDIAGCAGDLMTFYGEWRRDSDSYASATTSCAAKLARIDVVSTFKLRDLIEDADAYNIAMAVRGGTNIADDVLAHNANPKVTAARMYLCRTTGGATVVMPNVLDSAGKLGPFCKGFGDMLAARVGRENAKVAKLRAQGKI